MTLRFTLTPARIATAAIVLTILTMTALGVASVLKSDPAQAASSSSATGRWTRYDPTTPANPQAIPQAGRHKHPPSVNPCDDFAVVGFIATVLVGFVWYRRRATTLPG